MKIVDKRCTERIPFKHLSAGTTFVQSVCNYQDTQSVWLKLEDNDSGLNAACLNTGEVGRFLDNEQVEEINGSFHCITPVSRSASQLQGV